MTTIDNVTREQIEALMAAAGDSTLYRTCERALRGWDVTATEMVSARADAIRTCVRAIQSAETMTEGGEVAMGENKHTPGWAWVVMGLMLCGVVAVSTLPFLAVWMRW